MPTKSLLIRIIIFIIFSGIPSEKKSFFLFENIESIFLRELKIQIDKMAINGHLVLRTFAPNFSYIDFFLEILPLKDDELVMAEM